MKQTEAGTKLLQALDDFQADAESKKRYRDIVFSRARVLAHGIRSDTLKKA